MALRVGIGVVAGMVLVPATLALRPAAVGPDEATSRALPAPASHDRTAPLGRAYVDEASPAPPPPVSAARSELRSFHSRTLGRRMPYRVFLPPGYDSDQNARYPVLFMLHGLGGDLHEWTEYRLFEEAERLIDTGDIPPLIIVLPEGEQSYWVDHFHGPRWGAYLAQDVVAEIDGRYRTVADRSHRAVGGNSMGAHAALQLSMTYPDVFGVAGAHSPTLRGRDTLPSYFGDQGHFEAHDPVTLMERRPETARRLRLWIDVSDGDYFLGIVTEFHQRLEALGVPHAFHVWPGPHDDEYWRGNVVEYLRYYGAALR